MVDKLKKDIAQVYCWRQAGKLAKREIRKILHVFFRLVYLYMFLTSLTFKKSMMPLILYKEKKRGVKTAPRYAPWAPVYLSAFCCKYYIKDCVRDWYLKRKIIDIVDIFLNLQKFNAIWNLKQLIGSTNCKFVILNILSDSISLVLASSHLTTSKHVFLTNEITVNEIKAYRFV